MASSFQQLCLRYGTCSLRKESDGKVLQYHCFFSHLGFSLPFPQRFKALQLFWAFSSLHIFHSSDTSQLKQSILPSRAWISNIILWISVLKYYKIVCCRRIKSFVKYWWRQRFWMQFFNQDLKSEKRPAHL